MRSALTLRQAIFLGIALGVLLPALLLGGMLVHDRYTSAYRERVNDPLEQYASILVSGLELPLWNVDAEAAQKLVDAILSNPEVVRISVEDAALGRFLEREAADRRSGESLIARREIRRDGKLLGHLTIELSTGRIDQALAAETIKLTVTLLVQLSVSLILIFLLLESRLMQPLRTLRAAARRLASGDMEQPLQAAHPDELGELTAHFEEMRARLRQSFAETAQQRLALERELAAHRLAEDENRLLARVASSTNNAVIVTDAAGRIEWANTAFTTLTGYSLGEARGHKPGHLLQGPLTDAATVARIKELLASRQPFRDVELLNYTKDGRSYWISLDIEPIFDEDGVLQRFFAIERDITERKQADEALAANHEFVSKIIESLPGVFYLIDDEERFVLWNQNLERVAQRNAAAMAVTHPLELFAAQEKPLVAAAIAQTFAVGEAQAEASLVAADGSATPFFFTGLRVEIGGKAHLLGVGLDISARRRVEEELRASEAKFSAAINGSLDFISLSRLEDGRFILVNEAFEQLTGWTAAEAIGRTSLELGIWRDPRERAELVRRLRAGERVRSFPLHLGTKAGEVRECVMSAVIVRIAETDHMVAVVRDETSQRRADRALRRLAESGLACEPGRFAEAAVLDLSAALEVDICLIGLRMAPQSTQLQVMAIASRGKPGAPHLCDVAHGPGAHVLAGEICVHSDRVGELFPEDDYLRDEALRSYVGAPLRDESGRVIGVLAVMDSRPLAQAELARSLVQVFAARVGAELARERSDAALLASQTKFSALFHSSPVAMSVSRRQQGYAVIDVNDAWITQFMYRREDVIGKSGPGIGFWSNPADRDAVLAAIERDGAIQGYEAWLRRGDGEPILSLVSGRLIKVADEELLILAEEDVTERRRMERQLAELAANLEQRVNERTEALRKTNDELATALATLQRAQSELVRAEKLAALGALVAGIAHELNTPIGNCMTVASTLSEQVGEFDSAIREGLRRSVLDRFMCNTRNATDILLRNLQRASELVTSFKQVAVDQTSSQRRQFAIDEVVSEIVLTLQPTIRKTPYAVVCDVPGGLQCDSYPGPLGQIIANLINNALLHAFEGRASGTVRIAARALSDTHVELTVSDDGIGIPEADQARVFDPFFTTKLGRGGSGLGLHIVYNLVTGVLGGDIAVDSRVGDGSRFVLVFPFVAPSRDADEG